MVIDGHELILDEPRDYLGDFIDHNNELCAANMPRILAVYSGTDNCDSSKKCLYFLIGENSPSRDLDGELYGFNLSLSLNNPGVVFPLFSALPLSPERAKDYEFLNECVYEELK